MSQNNCQFTYKYKKNFFIRKEINSQISTNIASLTENSITGFPSCINCKYTLSHSFLKLATSFISTFCGSQMHTTHTIICFRCCVTRSVVWFLQWYANFQYCSKVQFLLWKSCFFSFLVWWCQIWDCWWENLQFTMCIRFKKNKKIYYICL